MNNIKERKMKTKWGDFEISAKKIVYNIYAIKILYTIYYAPYKICRFYNLLSHLWIFWVTL